MHIFSKDDGQSDGFVAPTAPVRAGSTRDRKDYRDSLHYDYTGGQVKQRGAGQAAGDTIRMSYPDQHHPDVQAAPQETKVPARGRRDYASDATQSDSGYSSSSPRNRLRSLPNEDGLKPVPVVWSNPEPADDRNTTPQPILWKRTQALAGNGDAIARPDMGLPRRSQSMRSFRTPVATESSFYAGDGGSMRTAPSGRVRRRVSLNGGSFANGAGTIGPNAHPTDDETGVFRARSINADAGLSKKQKLKIGKTEGAFLRYAEVHDTYFNDHQTSQRRQTARQSDEGGS